MLEPKHKKHLEEGKPLKDLKFEPVSERTKREKRLVTKTMVL